MGNNSARMPFTSKLLILLHLILGVGAVFGGSVLVIDPSGKLVKMPIELLETAPFNSFLIPGIILFVVLGVLPLIVSFALATKRELRIANGLNLFADMYWAWAYSIYVSFALIIWITIETFFIQHVAIIHVAYIFLGLTIQAVTLLPSVQKYYRV